MSDEKRFKIEELPDEGSDPLPRASRKKTPPNKMEPRVEKLKTMDAGSQIEALIQKWTFDTPEKNHGWIAYIAILGILEFTPVYDTYMQELAAMNAGFFDVGGDIMRSFTIVIEGVIRHPIVLALLTPLFFKFSHPSEYLFSITFDGIQTVKKVLPVGSKALVDKKFVAWKEFQKVEKGSINNKEILKLYSPEGHIGEIIWYIDLDKKRAIKKLLSGMVGLKHPFREFLEKEKELL